MSTENSDNLQYLRRVDAYQHARGLRRQEACQEIGISEGRLSDIRTGKANPSAKLWHRLEEAERRAGLDSIAPADPPSYCYETLSQELADLARRRYPASPEERTREEERLVRLLDYATGGVQRQLRPPARVVSPPVRKPPAATPSQAAEPHSPFIVQALSQGSRSLGLEGLNGEVAAQTIEAKHPALMNEIWQMIRGRSGHPDQVTPYWAQDWPFSMGDLSALLEAYRVFYYRYYRRRGRATKK